MAPSLAALALSLSVAAAGVSEAIATRTDIDGDVPALPALPLQFSAIVEANILEKNYTMTVRAWEARDFDQEYNPWEPAPYQALPLWMEFLQDQQWHDEH